MCLKFGFMKELSLELNVEGSFSGCRQQKWALANWRQEEKKEKGGVYWVLWESLLNWNKREQTLWIDVSGLVSDFFFSRAQSIGMGQLQHCWVRSLLSRYKFQGGKAWQVSLGPCAHLLAHTVPEESFLKGRSWAVIKGQWLRWWAPWTIDRWWE